MEKQLLVSMPPAFGILCQVPHCKMGVPVQNQVELQWLMLKKILPGKYTEVILKLSSRIEPWGGLSFLWQCECKHCQSMNYVHLLYTSYILYKCNVYFSGLKPKNKYLELPIWYKYLAQKTSQTPLVHFYILRYTWQVYFKLLYGWLYFLWKVLITTHLWPAGSMDRSLCKTKKITTVNMTQILFLSAIGQGI